jgi:hypothetical protein
VRAGLTAAIAALLLLPGAAQAGTFTPISTGRFKLISHGFDAANSNRISQLSQTYPQVGLGALLKDTNRKNTALMRDRAPVGAFGYSWKSSGSIGGDNGVDYWTPQGITGNGGNVQAVSWYRGKSGHETSVRIAFVNRNEGAHGEYRFGLLVKPTGGSHFAQVKRHAGGIAWVGPYLYMADTHYGIRVFDLTRTLQVPKSRKGSTGDYRYLIPQIGSYQRSGGGALTFSALSLDRSNPGAPAIVAGEYLKRTKKHPVLTRIARWPINGKSRVARSEATQAWHTTFDQLQGVITHNGRVFVSSTQGAGVLYHGLPRKAAQADPWGKGPEGLYAVDGQLWTLTEARNHRTVFGKTFKSLLK